MHLITCSFSWSGLRLLSKTGLMTKVLEIQENYSDLQTEIQVPERGRFWRSGMLARCEALPDENFLQSS
jgi:hypothetical protein